MALPNADDSILLLHNPKCSKSRETLALLEDRGVAFETRLYLESPLDDAELLDLGTRLGKDILAFTRTKQAEFGKAGLTKDSDSGAVRAAMTSTPILMERPILIRGARAAIGRPPEDVLAILD